MSIISSIHAEIHREVVQRAIAKAKEEVLPLCNSAHAKDKVEAALEIVSHHCETYIQE